MRISGLDKVIHPVATTVLGHLDVDIWRSVHTLREKLIGQGGILAAHTLHLMNEAISPWLAERIDRSAYSKIPNSDRVEPISGRAFIKEAIGRAETTFHEDFGKDPDIAYAAEVFRRDTTPKIIDADKAKYLEFSSLLKKHGFFDSRGSRSYFAYVMAANEFKYRFGHNPDPKKQLAINHPVVPSLEERLNPEQIEELHAWHRILEASAITDCRHEYFMRLRSENSND